MLTIAAVWLIAATVTPLAPLPQSPPPPAGALLVVPYLPQTPDLCGGAALAMVLRYWGNTDVVPTDFSALVDDRAHGISTDALTAAVRAHGAAPMVTHAAGAALLSIMKSDIDRGRPVIALIEDTPGALHYVVIVGVTDTTVVFHDPARACVIANVASSATEREISRFIVWPS